MATIVIDGAECTPLSDKLQNPQKVLRVEDGLVAYLGLGQVHWGKDISDLQYHDGGLVTYSLIATDGSKKTIFYDSLECENPDCRGILLGKNAMAFVSRSS